jgi:hypothetical protein
MLEKLEGRLAPSAQLVNLPEININSSGTDHSYILNVYSLMSVAITLAENGPSHTIISKAPSFAPSHFLAYDRTSVNLQIILQNVRSYLNIASGLSHNCATVGGLNDRGFSKNAELADNSFNLFPKCDPLTDLDFMLIGEPELNVIGSK